MDARTRFDGMMNELKRTRDEIRLHLHLAGMDARSAWEKLAPSVDELERRLNNAGDLAAHELELAFDKLGRAIAQIKDDVVPPPPSGPRL